MRTHDGPFPSMIVSCIGPSQTRTHVQRTIASDGDFRSRSFDNERKVAYPSIRLNIHAHLIAASQDCATARMSRKYQLWLPFSEVQKESFANKCFE